MNPIEALNIVYPLLDGELEELTKDISIIECQDEDEENIGSSCGNSCNGLYIPKISSCLLSCCCGCGVDTISSNTLVEIFCLGKVVGLFN
jgi:hypothetical protein